MVSTLLAGDIGGTWSRLALFEVADGRLQMRDHERYPSEQHAGLAEIAQRFLAVRPQSVQRACFGVAGPVHGGRVHTTNLPWNVDATDLARATGLAAVDLINDLEATVYGLPALGPADFAVLNTGAPDAAGNQAVIAAGTGLGEAGIFWDGQRAHPLATEGGHADFAPRNDLEIELLRYLLPRFGHVSVERVVSGPGLCHIYEFLRDTGRGAESGAVRQEMERDDPPAVITRRALAGADDLCVQALTLFVSLYGAEAGNLALKVMATGGVFVGGGIAPRIVETLRGPGFMASFTAKGRHQALLAAIPVRVVLNDGAALLGAAHYAALRAALMGD